MAMVVFRQNLTVFFLATRTWGNVSVITLLDPPSDGAHDYTCIASNGLGSANATYLQHPPIASKLIFFKKKHHLSHLLTGRVGDIDSTVIINRAHTM